MITRDLLVSILNYDRETGIFIRKSTKKPTGWTKKTGYIQIRINNRLYQAHRLAFLYMEGYFPEGQVDHKDRVRNNNKWDNLREASQQCQSRNCSLSNRNTSNVKGVCWKNGESKCRVGITVDQKNFCLGRFDDFVEAVANRFAHEQALNWDMCDVDSTSGKFLKAYIGSSDTTSLVIDSSSGASGVVLGGF